MALFQTSVLKKYLKTQDQDQIKKAYKKFSNYFLNLSIQENIKSSKEEEYQGIFLTELFVKVLGYTMKPNVDFNLVAEYKNQTNSRKADGAILKDDIAIGVIELKGTNTKDLESIRKQAFDYKANQKGCKYVITSNFEKLRFYINDATEYLEFNLFGLTEEQFTLLYLCLSKDNLLQNIPLEIKEASLVEENQITKGFYKDYSVFKRELYRDLVRNNAKKLKAIRKNELFKEIEETATLEAEIDRLEKNVKLTLFKKSQKLIDRFLFIFFAEDRGLLPPNAILQIIEDWHKLKDLDVSQPLYERFKLYFSYLDTGRKGTDKKAEIFAYNGGLFKPDAVLDLLEISDELLYQHTAKLSSYDFESQVDVNILGHIFENSLNEIESVNAEIEGDNFDKQKSKRKKDGVFYTPKYITKYIVENTVSKLCQEKKAELDFHEENYFEVKKGTKTATKKKLLTTLDAYRDWLLQLTICDPACGSGAFLNQALEFLIAEHAYIDELKAKVLGGAIVFSDIENTILENNIYGVDINEESVEIAKLSLWLRTAQPRRKLNDLSSNIKCGNSLIEDKSVAGDKAFKWELEFPTVFAKGGFDVVIGNPPYLRKQGLVEHYPKMVEYYEQNFTSATGNYDIYALFMERSYRLINQSGIVSFILPHKFLIADFGLGIRKFFKEKTAVNILVHFGSEIVFTEAATYTCIIDLTKTRKEKLRFKKLKPEQLFEPFVWESMNYEKLTTENWDLQSEEVVAIIEKLEKQPQTIDSVFDKIFQGIATSLDAVYVFQGEDCGNFIKGYNEKYDYHFEIEKEIVKPFVKGNQLSRNTIPKINYYVIFPYKLNGNTATPFSEDYIKNNLPKTYSYLKHFEKEIRGRERGRMDIEEGWFLYIYPKNLPYFQNPKIMTQEISLGCNMTYDHHGEFYHPTTIYSFVKKDEFEVDEKYYLGIMNSKVMWFFLKNTGTELRGGYFRFKTNYLKPFPLPKISSNAQEIINLVNEILDLNKGFSSKTVKFQNYLLSQYPIEKLSKKLQNWHELDFGDFIKELNKAINKENRARRKNEETELPKLTKKDEFEWMELFEDNKKKAVELQTEINRIDNQIDQMVYELYGLTEEEIKIVEES
ncbi:Eco57I restriction-modification methylase domain-containing protein [uncultured Mesonia sp.]|uniref:Eco57I restriction-modification methylase domain-containing protein n=1 Tax=uncultured Mesonia sp. TaxID=399731 RepID=UPI00374FD593